MGENLLFSSPLTCCGVLNYEGYGTKNKIGKNCKRITFAALEYQLMNPLSTTSRSKAHNSLTYTLEIVSGDFLINFRWRLSKGEKQQFNLWKLDDRKLMEIIFYSNLIFLRDLLSFKLFLHLKWTKISLP